MTPWAVGVRERGRTYEGCRDLHQTGLVLAGAWRGGGTLWERETPSFELMPEGLRISFETTEDGEELLESRALHGLYCVAPYRCALQYEALRDGVKGRARVRSLSIRPETKWTFLARRSSLAIIRVALPFLAAAIAAASFGRSFRLPLSTSQYSPISTPAWLDIWRTTASRWASKPRPLRPLTAAQCQQQPSGAVPSDHLAIMPLADRNDAVGRGRGAQASALRGQIPLQWRCGDRR